MCITHENVRKSNENKAEKTTRRMFQKKADFLLYFVEKLQKQGENRPKSA